MNRCIACGKTALISTMVGNCCFCASCATKIGVLNWKNRCFSSIEELFRYKQITAQAMQDNNFSAEAFNAVNDYFDAYIDAGFITAINGFAGQVLKVFNTKCIIETKSEEKREELIRELDYAIDDEPEPPKESIIASEKTNIVKGLLSGKIVQTGVGLITSAVIDSKTREEDIQRKHEEKRRKVKRMICVGEQPVELKDIQRVETYCETHSQRGYLRFVPKNSLPDDYSCIYFFFNNNIPLESKRIKKQLDIIRDQLNERIMAIVKEEKEEEGKKKARKEEEEKVQKESDKIDVFDEIRKFKLLLDDGIITEEEFTKKKKELLGL